MVHCTCVIDNTAGNGYLLSDLECVGLKHNHYLRSAFVLPWDFLKMSKEEKAVNFSSVTAAAAPAALCFSIMQLLMNLSSESYAIAQWAWQCVQTHLSNSFWLYRD